MFRYKQLLLLGLVNADLWQWFSLLSPLRAVGTEQPVLAVAPTPSSQRGSGSAVLGTDGAGSWDLAGSGASGLEDSQPPLPCSVLRCVALLRASLHADLGFP